MLISKTLVAKLATRFSRQPVATKLTTLKSAINDDYDIRSQIAEQARLAGVTEISEKAKGELAAIEATLASAKRRAAALDQVGILTGDAGDRAAKLGAASL